MKHVSRIRCHAPALLAAFGFVLRALVPVGYMPATLADGGPFILCDWQNATLVATLAPESQSAGAHTHNSGAHSPADHAPSGEPTDHDANQHDNWAHCPLGVGVASAPLPVEYAFAFPPPRQAIEPPCCTSTPSTPILERYRARAPPF